MNFDALSILKTGAVSPMCVVEFIVWLDAWYEEIIGRDEHAGSGTGCNLPAYKASWLAAHGSRLTAPPADPKFWS